MFSGSKLFESFSRPILKLASTTEARRFELRMGVNAAILLIYPELF
jgi:hypothetical protein